MFEMKGLALNSCLAASVAVLAAVVWSSVSEPPPPRLAAGDACVVDGRRTFADAAGVPSTVVHAWPSREAVAGGPPRTAELRIVPAGSTVVVERDDREAEAEFVGAEVVDARPVEVRYTGGVLDGRAGYVERYKLASVGSQDGR